jgi:hypothetical protein
MNANKRRFLTSFAIEIVVYAALMFAYFFLVLHFLSGWITQLCHEHPTGYAFVALGLMVGQGVALELVTSALFRFIRERVG